MDLDKALDYCSYYRFTFLAAGAEIEAKLAKVNREFNTWYAEVEQEVRRNTITERLAVKEKDKVPNNWFGSMTKQEIEGRILTDENYSKTYNSYQTKMEGMKKTMKLLYGLRDILQDRGGHLQSLGKRRLENRKWSFGVKDHVT